MARRVRIQVLLTVLLVSTHLVGAVVVAAISVLVLPTEAVNDSSRVALAISVPVYVGVAILVGSWWGTRVALRGTTWMLAGRSPNAQDRRTTLRTPLRLTLIQGGLWFVAFLLFTGQAVVLQPSRALGTGFAVAISGLVVSGIAYLLTEFAMRPVAALVLTGEDRLGRGAARVSTRMILFWVIGTGAPIAGLAVAAVVALSSPDATKERLAVTALALCAVVLVFGQLVTILNARSVVAPVATVRNALQRVRGGDLDVEVTVFDGTELGLLQAGFNDMVRGLREREAIRDMFGRYVGREVAAAAAGKEVSLGGETQVVSVLFIDLVGSTTYATERDPHEVVATLNRFFAVVVEEVDEHHGLVNKFMGDAALAIFGAPVAHDDHALQALQCARAIAIRLEAEVPEITAGIGVATGEAVAGNIGDASRFEYTVIGDSVNSAARLCELSKDVPGRILVSASSVERAGSDEAVHWQTDGEVVLRGRTEPTGTAKLAE